MKLKILVIAMVAALATPALAQPVAVVNARVLTLGPQGGYARASVLIENGKIVAVGPDLSLPADTRIVDGSGKTITPGLVATVTPLGLTDLAPALPGLSSSAPGLGAAFEIAADVNPRNPQIAEARIEGVTRAVVIPNASRVSIFGGQAALVHLSDSMDIVENKRLALFMDGGGAGAQAAGGSRGALHLKLREHLEAAKAFALSTPPSPPGGGLSRMELIALAPVAMGKMPLLVEVNRASDILAMLAIARETGIKLVLSGAAEGWMVAREIADAKVPVILDGEQNQADSYDALNASYDNAAKLQAAGVLIAIKPGIARVMILTRTPRFIAGRATRFGLAPDDALAAITINPAKIFGFDKQFGSIEPGKDADLVLWSGDPLETTTVAKMVMIKGVEQPLTARNRALRDRYIGSILQPRR